ncbi:hypothetical protein OAS07_02625 [Candidatus Thioglobus sp.]|nr:hypothetical protein [Candidatus Thioglobus sp.]MDC1165314.1 hypothetical protein [Candidatus Thioglobus sp.]
MIKEKYFSNITDPWIDHMDVVGIPESRMATLNRYRQILFLSKFPRIEVKERRDILVIGTSIYKRLDSNLKQKTHVVISARDILRDFSILGKLVRSFTFDLAIYGRIYNQIINSSNSEEFLNIKHALDVIKPKIIILKSTIDPINRVWAFYAAELNIKVVCVQHGIFSSKTSPEVLEQDIVDYYVVSGDKQSEIISPIIPEHKHINLFESSSFSCELKNKKTISICFIGTDHEVYSEAGKRNKEKVLDIYIDLVNALSEDKCVKYKFFYKMHPSETKGNKVMRLAKIIQKTDYNKIDIFFGVASSLLMELASLQKCTIQLRSKSLPTDNYQELGYCATIEINKIKNEGLLNVLKENNTFPCLKEKGLSKIITSLL